MVTKIIPQDQISAGWAKYGFVSTSGATYGKVPHFLSSIRSLPRNLKLVNIQKLISIEVYSCIPKERRKSKIRNFNNVIIV